MTSQSDHYIVDDHRDIETGERVMVCKCGFEVREANPRSVQLLMDAHLEKEATK